jgi:hypothetical protein
MILTFIRQINGDCWLYRDQDGHFWHLGFPLRPSQSAA